MNRFMIRIPSLKLIAAQSALAVAVFALSTSSARADDFTFSFSNTVGDVT